MVVRGCAAPGVAERRVDAGCPTRAAASAHWVLRCSVGATTVTRSTTPRCSSSAATRSAKVVLPAPGVATARKSRGWSVEVLLQRRGLPGAQLGGGAPGRPLGERGGQVGCGCGAHRRSRITTFGRSGMPGTTVHLDGARGRVDRRVAGGLLGVSPCRPAARAGPRRSPCTSGRPGTSPGRGRAPRPCRTAR